MSQPQGESAGLPRAAGRSRRAGVFSRQLVLGDNLDLDRTEASYDAGVLRLVVPVAERAKPRRIEIGGRRGHSPPQHPDPGRRGLSTTEA